MRIRLKPFKPFRRYWIIQILILLCLGALLWQGLHKQPSVSLESYSYLTQIPTQVVLTSYQDGKNLSPTGWADFIAIRTTLSTEQANFILEQLRKGTLLEKVAWEFKRKPISSNQIKLIHKRKQVLLSTHYYEPGYFAFPVQGKTWYEDTFGADREGGVRRHEGTDLFGPEGTPLVSVCSGEIEKLGWNRLGGERVGVRGEDGNYYYYAHLQTIEPSLKLGQTVQKGDPIGTMGHTGDALTTPDHLHFGIELPNGMWINPYPFLYVWQHQGKPQ